MFDPTIIFQRTQAGRNEIYEKKCGLTQSERLVLIMVDGTTPYREVRAKLPALTDERFSRAIGTLQKKELVLEVFLPVEGQAPEEVERTVVDRFLQQDPTDPLTIISFDPDEEFGVELDGSVSASAKPVTPKQPQNASSAPFPVLNTSPIIDAPLTSSAGIMDESLIEQAESLGEEVRARRLQYVNPIDQALDRSAQRRPDVKRKPEPDPVQPARVHWGYWMIGVGLAFIIGFFIARLLH